MEFSNPVLLISLFFIDFFGVSSEEGKAMAVMFSISSVGIIIFILSILISRVFQR